MGDHDRYTFYWWTTATLVRTGDRGHSIYFWSIVRYGLFDVRRTWDSCDRRIIHLILASVIVKGFTILGTNTECWTILAFSMLDLGHPIHCHLSIDHES